MWAVLVSTIFCIFSKESLLRIWSMKFCVPFLIIPNDQITTGIIFALNFHILITSISRFLYFESFWNSFNETWVLPRPSWCKFVLHDFWLLYSVCLHLFFYLCEQWNPMVWLHFFLLRLVPVYARTISPCVVSHNVYIVSSV